MKSKIKTKLTIVVKTILGLNQKENNYCPTISEMRCSFEGCELKMSCEIYQLLTEELNEKHS